MVEFVCNGYGNVWPVTKSKKVAGNLWPINPSKPNGTATASNGKEAGSIDQSATVTCSAENNVKRKSLAVADKRDLKKKCLGECFSPMAETVAPMDVG